MQCAHCYYLILEKSGRDYSLIYGARGVARRGARFHGTSHLWLLAEVVGGAVGPVLGVAGPAVVVLENRDLESSRDVDCGLSTYIISQRLLSNVDISGIL